MKNQENIRLLSINKREPNEGNIQQGHYPFVTEYYAVYRKDNKNPQIKAFVKWLQSNEGKEVIRLTGYIPY